MINEEERIRGTGMWIYCRGNDHGNRIYRIVTTYNIGDPGEYRSQYYKNTMCSLEAVDLYKIYTNRDAAE